jgi:hypothetical protein
VDEFAGFVRLARTLLGQGGDGSGAVFMFDLRVIA